MNIVVDTNIVFSTLLNPKSSIGEILMNLQDKFIFFGPELLIDELQRYAPKIAAYTKLTPHQLTQMEQLVLSSITLVSEELISERSWTTAYELAKDIDEDDTPFVALALELNTKLWTGDKVLAKGLQKNGSDLAITTTEMKNILK
ncbi:PIN domain-containing protein [Parapedobacter sp. DT-150]|uniref:PIN domain-containing protein n=1 Tax=Parapedobacter sp. DT-150 TaxID=3396162 RepID=UPI003F1DBF4C